jgi:predicted nucleic acid-binding protein
MGTRHPIFRRSAVSRHAGVIVTEPVVMEWLAGARTDERESDLRRLLRRFELLRFEGAADFDGAVASTF